MSLMDDDWVQCQSANALANEVQTWSTSMSRSRVSTGDGLGFSENVDAEAMTSLEVLLRTVQQLKLKRFRVEEFGETQYIAAGETFVVSKCNYQGSVIAIKRIRIDGEKSKRQHFLRRLQSVLREVLIMCHPPLLHHPNIVSLLGYGWSTVEMQLSPFLSLEFATGGSLREHLKGRPQSIRSKLILMGDLASGLMALHRCGIVHGDLKADNVVIFSSLDRPSLSLAKLSDFGHSILVGSTPEKKAHYLGTALYNAPEVAVQKDRSIPIEQLHKCDIWAFGLCVWEILADGNSYFQPDWRNDVAFEKPPSYNIASISTSSKPHEVSVGEDNQKSFGNFDFSNLKRLSVQFLESLKIPGIGFEKAFLRPLLNGSLEVDPAKRISDLSRLPIIGFWNKTPGEHSLQSKLATYTLSGDIRYSIFNRDGGPYIIWEQQQQLLQGFETLAEKKEPMKDNGSAAFQTMLCYVNAFGTSTNLGKATRFLHKTQESGHLVARILGSRLLSAFTEAPSLLSGEYGDCLASGFRLISSQKSPTICLHIGKTSTEFTDYIALRTAFIDEEGFVEFDQDDIATANLERNNSSERQNILEIAIQEGDIDLVDLLLRKHGLKLNEMKTRECLLVQAARNGHGPIVNRLLQEDISIFRDDSSSCLLHWLFCLNDPSLHQLQQQLQSPSRKDDLKRALDHAITQKVPIHPQWPFQVYGTPLATAIASGNISVVKVLLALKADPTASAFLSIEGDVTLPALTPIHLAISYHLPEVVKILWYAAFGENVITASQLSRTHALSQFPIACALSFRSNAERFAMHMNNHRLRIRDIIQLLPIEALIQSSPEGKNALTQAIDLEDVDTVNLILECHPELAARKITQPGANNMFTYPLHFAVQIGSLRETDESIQILESIIKLDPTAVNRLDSSSAKPIHAAAMGTSTRILNLLLENGSTCHDLDGRGRTPLFFCRKATMTNSLLQIGADINHRDQQGFTPAHAAPSEGTEEVLGALIESGADLSLTNNSIGTPLHCAVREKSLSMVGMLLKAGVDVNAKNTYGRTALLVATSMDTRRSDLVSLLFENGADPFIEDNNGLSPFHMALAWPNTSILSKFQTLSSFNTLQWERKIVALHFAAERAEPAALTLFLHKAFGSGLSTDNPVFLYHKDVSIALHKAILACRADLVEAMLSYGFQVNSLDSNGNTPLLIACQLGRDGSPSTNTYARTPICEMLLAHGAKIYKTEGRDMTPFFIAHAHKDYPLMTLLLEHALELGNLDSVKLRARMLESIKDLEKSSQYPDESRALIGDEVIDPQVVLQATTEGEWEFIMTCIGGQFISKEELRQVFRRRRWSFGVDSLDMLRFHSARRDREMVRYLHEMAVTGRLTLQRTSEIGQRNLQLEFGGWRVSLNETLWPKKIDKLYGGEKEGSPKQRERSKRFILMLRNYGARESENWDKEMKCGWSSDELSDDSVSSDDESGSEEPGDGSGMQESGGGVGQDDDEPAGYDVKLPVSSSC
ncbi:hypothetical protein N7466_002530 [Penicillium verhagenii]|uniref:uncharacterized protein n=1 Tax=Penicillium verhagenii TaxID=1562060 RepID=UPI002544D396|nr:uncharacterized protein N7466_002530 [Penicillium verhagenii]KAJ5939396.1 hypothetical protein N7466_002530 [Penicillium verhagenii]